MVGRTSSASVTDLRALACSDQVLSEVILAWVSTSCVHSDSLRYLHINWLVSSSFDFSLIWCRIGFLLSRTNTTTREQSCYSQFSIVLHFSAGRSDQISGIQLKDKSLLSRKSFVTTYICMYTKRVNISHTPERERLNSLHMLWTTFTNKNTCSTWCRM